MNSPRTDNIVEGQVERLRKERDELLALLRKLIEGDVGRDVRWKLAEGQATETEDGKVWLAAKALVEGTQGARCAAFNSTTKSQNLRRDGKHDGP